MKKIQNRRDVKIAKKAAKVIRLFLCNTVAISGLIKQSGLVSWCDLVDEVINKFGICKIPASLSRQKDGVQIGSRIIPACPRPAGRQGRHMLSR